MNTEHGGMYDQAPVEANPNNLEENDHEEQVQLLAQDQAHGQQEIENARVRLLPEQDANRRQIAPRAQMIDHQVQDENLARQLQNDEDEACQCCIVM